MLLRNGEDLLNFSQEFLNWQNKIKLAKSRFPKANFPDFQTITLLETSEMWLAPQLVSIKKKEDLKKIDLIDTLSLKLNYEQILLLKELP